MTGKYNSGACFICKIIPGILIKGYDSLVVPDGAVAWKRDQLGISVGVIEYRYIVYDEHQLIDILGEYMDACGYSSFLHHELLRCQKFLEKGVGDSLGKGKGEKLIEMSNKVVASGKHKQTQIGAKRKDREADEQQEIWGDVTRAKTQEILVPRRKVQNPSEASCEENEHSHAKRQRKGSPQTTAPQKRMRPSHHRGRCKLVEQQEKIREAKRRDGSPKRAVDAIEKNVVEKKASSGSGYPDPASHVLHPQHNGLPAYFAARRAPQDFWTSPAHPTQRTDTGKNHGLIYYGPSGGPRSSRINDCEGPGCFTKMSGVEEWNRHDNHYYCRRCYEDNNFLKTERKRAASSGSAAAASSSAQVAPRTDVIRGASSGSG